MKYLKIALVLLLATTTLIANSQVRFGIKGGLNITSYLSDDEKIDDENLKYGFNAGVYLRLPVVSLLSLQTELLYTQKGSKIEMSKFGNVEINTTSSTDYIELPVLLDIAIIDILHVHAGPYFSYLINKKSLTSNSDNNNIVAQVKDDFKKVNLNELDYGLAFGASLVSRSLELSLRYNYGVKTLGKENTILGNKYTFPDVKHSAVYVSLGLSF
ncbi:MAG: porin family protein [Lentimicrobiaceae bacterium]|nr:porin family protein [Lentimicrobiaceae bacterium]